MIRDMTPVLSKERMMHMDNLKKLRLLNDAASGKIKSPEPKEGAFTSVSSFVKNILQKQSDVTLSIQLTEAAEAAASLVEHVDSVQKNIEIEMVRLRRELKRLKNRTTILQTAKEHGALTSNYIPLVALIIPYSDLAYMKLTDEELALPLPVKPVRKTRTKVKS